MASFFINLENESSVLQFLISISKLLYFLDPGARSCHYIFCSYVEVNSGVVSSWYYSNVVYLKGHLGYLSIVVFLSFVVGHRGLTYNPVFFALSQLYVLRSKSHTFCKNNRSFCLGLVVLHICFVKFLVFYKVQLTACYPIVLYNSLDGYKSVCNTILSCHVHSKDFCFYIIMSSYD